MSAAPAAQAASALPGSQFPLGATVRDGGTNFAVASEVADGMVLCVFDQAGTETRIPMRSYDAGVWHVFVPGVGAGQAYGYRAAGPYAPGQTPARSVRPGVQQDGQIRARGVRALHQRSRFAERGRFRGQRSAQPGGG